VPASPSASDDTQPSADRKRSTGTMRAPMRPMQTIMLVTGRSGLMETLVELLSDQDYELLVYERGEEAVRDVNMTHLDLILIDAVGKDTPGMELCKQIRKRTEVPIILVADKASDAEKVAGLNAGADDFIIRPISNDELLVRVQVIFKRQHIQDRTSEPLVFGNLYIDLARREVLLSDKAIELTRIEYNLLQVLVVNRGQVLTHKQLLDKVWGPEYDGETHYLWVNISRLRKKLEARRDGVRYIHTQQGVGYYFDVQ
jgi:two-component system KDP operon response regulator KdpE